LPLYRVAAHVILAAECAAINFYGATQPWPDRTAGIDAVIESELAPTLRRFMFRTHPDVAR